LCLGGSIVFVCFERREEKGHNVNKVNIFLIGESNANKEMDGLRIRNDVSF
jgi:hypothetical protein